MSQACPCPLPAWHNCLSVIGSESKGRQLRKNPWILIDFEYFWIRTFTCTSAWPEHDCFLPDCPETSFYDALILDINLWSDYRMHVYLTWKNQTHVRQQSLPSLKISEQSFYFGSWKHIRLLHSYSHLLHNADIPSFLQPWCMFRQY